MMRLYSYWRSSSAWRVRIALHVKQIDYVTVPVHLVADGGAQHEPGYVSKNPMAQVPLLEIDVTPQGSSLGDVTEVHRISQSMAILAYLEEGWPAPALLPSEPYRRARVRQLAYLISSGIQPLQNLSVLQHLEGDLGQDRKAWAQRFIERGLSAYEGSSRGIRGLFSVGDEPSWADLCLIPQLYNARRFEVDLSKLSPLIDIERRCQALTPFQQAHPDRQIDAPAPK